VSIVWPRDHCKAHSGLVRRICHPRWELDVFARMSTRPGTTFLWSQQVLQFQQYTHTADKSSSAHTVSKEGNILCTSPRAGVKAGKFPILSPLQSYCHNDTPRAHKASAYGTDTKMCTSSNYLGPPFARSTKQYDPIVLTLIQFSRRAIVRFEIRAVGSNKMEIDSETRNVLFSVECWIDFNGRPLQNLCPDKSPRRRSILLPTR
jgi:hypothetical protein